MAPDFDVALRKLRKRSGAVAHIVEWQSLRYLPFGFEGLFVIILRPDELFVLFILEGPDLILQLTTVENKSTPCELGLTVKEDLEIIGDTDGQFIHRGAGIFSLATRQTFTLPCLVDVVWLIAFQC